ncbi:MAG: NAD(P)H-dependent oxidoreductase subunit E [Anaerolineae bacterium]
MSHRKIVHKPIDPQIETIVEEHGQQAEAALEVLKAIQAQRGGLSPEVIDDAARALKLPPRHLYGLATFYSMLSLTPRQHVLRVCDGPVCWLKRASDRSAVAEWQETAGDLFAVERTSCLGLCDRAPAVLVDDEQAGPLSPGDVSRLTVGWRGEPMDYSTPRRGEVRVMTALLGKINPDSIEDALAQGVYDGLKKALQMAPEDVLNTVDASGLQGRGGAGFPVGRKWRFVAQANNPPPLPDLQCR